MGNGLSVKYWKDKWCGYSPFYFLFFFIIIFFIDKEKMYIKKRGDTKIVPSEYIGSIQKKSKCSN